MYGFKIGDAVRDRYDNSKGKITKMMVIAGLMTYYVKRKDGTEVALYEDELKKSTEE